jgi:hypothetical protein
VLRECISPNLGSAAGGACTASTQQVFSPHQGRPTSKALCLRCVPHYKIIFWPTFLILKKRSLCDHLAVCLAVLLCIPAKFVMRLKRSPCCRCIPQIILFRFLYGPCRIKGEQEISSSQNFLSHIYRHKYLPCNNEKQTNKNWSLIFKYIDLNVTGRCCLRISR